MKFIQLVLAYSAIYEYINFSNILFFRREGLLTVLYPVDPASPTIEVVETPDEIIALLKELDR